MPARTAVRRLLPLVGRGSLACAGIAALVLLIDRAGAGTVAAALYGAAAWLPLLLSMEGCRIVLELVSTRSLLGSASAQIPLRNLVRLQLAAYGVSTLVPAGRPASEAVKAAGLTPFVGGARAAAIATYGQVLNLLAEATLCGAVLLLLGVLEHWSFVASAVLVHFAVCAAAAFLLLAGVRSPALLSVSRRFPRVAGPLNALSTAARELPGVPLVPFLAFTAAKALQVSLLCLLLNAGGVDLDLFRVVHIAALSSLASAAGDFVPAQIGTIDGIFAMGSDSLGTQPGVTLGATTLFHCVQLSWVAATSIALLRWRSHDERTTFALQN